MFGETLVVLQHKSNHTHTHVDFCLSATEHTFVSVYFSFHLTFLLADAFVFDNVFMVERLQDVDLAREVVALLLPVLRLQGLHCHQLTCSVSPRVIAAQLHLTEVALHEERGRNVSYSDNHEQVVVYFVCGTSCFLSLIKVLMFCSVLLLIFGL